MAIRYFKCHTLPYPSYGLTASAAKAGEVDLAWTNGPPGGSNSGSTLIEYATLSNTAATTVAAVAYTDLSATIAGLSAVDYRFRIRRVNAIGLGEWTNFVQARAT